MQAGQLSFDVLLMTIALIIFLGSLTAIAGFIESTQGESAISLQEKKVLAETAHIISVSRIFADGAPGTQLSYTTPKMVTQNGKTTGCQISLSPAENTITVSAQSGQTTLQQTRKAVFDTTQFSYPTSVQCGAPLTIRRI